MFQQGWRLLRIYGPELSLALCALVTFLGLLGAVDLWGKREQRAAAEALDTIQHDRWLIAEIQGRPRLEKPPLPRWTSALLLKFTGQIDEWVVRLPSALSAVLVVALVFDLGRRIGGRSIGFVSGLVFCATFYAITEHRQAGNDGPLSFFTSLAIYAGWRRLHRQGPYPESTGPTDDPGHVGWTFAMYAALGLGMLTKGPIALVVTALTLVPYLTMARRLQAGLRILSDWRGMLLMVLIVLCWALPVIIVERESLDIWLLEIGQKVGSAGIAHHESRPLFLSEWVWIVMPWTPLALLGFVRPFTRQTTLERPTIWFPWFWTFANLAMLSTWSVAKPNYYLPCLPGVALVVGPEWIRVAQQARKGVRAARILLQGFWVSLFVIAAVGAIILTKRTPEYSSAALIMGTTVMIGVVISARIWHRGHDALSIAPIVGSISIATLIAYGAIAQPFFNAQSHRPLARIIERIVPSEEQTIMFFHEIDEGIWFYLHDHYLKPVPLSQPKYNDGFDLVRDAQNDQLVRDPAERQRLHRQLLLDWINDPNRKIRYVLIRDRFYQAYAPVLAGQVRELYRETDLMRNELVLLEIAQAPHHQLSVQPPQPSDVRQMR